MSNISNWKELYDNVNNEKGKIFRKLLLKIDQTTIAYKKSIKLFDMNTVQKNHQEIFNVFRLTYEQLLIEENAVDIFAEIKSLTSDIIITFNIIFVGKWIKLHNQNSSKIFFFDEEKTMISDKSMADFLNKIELIKPQYKYFGKEPEVYYKFRTLPSQDVVDYLKKFGVVAMEYNQKTPTIYCDTIDKKQNVLLDQTVMLTLCSSLSYGLSESFYETENNYTKEDIIKNFQDMRDFLTNKNIIVNQYIYDQVKNKIDHVGGSLEKKRFDELCKNIIFQTKEPVQNEQIIPSDGLNITVVPDDNNPRFYYLKDIELNSVSVAEREHAIFVTSNQRLCNKIDTYYPEIPYKLFYGVQLAETKYI